MTEELCPQCREPVDGICHTCLVGEIFSDQNDYLDLPSTLGGFELKERIGQGASGEVWLAFQPGPNREVALKIFLDPLLGGRADRTRFFSEAEALGKLDHPGIVPVYATGEEDGFLFIASRWMSGGTLEGKNFTANANRNSSRSTALLVREIARAAAHAHRHGLVHRDIKPANILLDDEGTPFLADFGIAEPTGYVTEGSGSGTPAFMAPEQARGEAATTSSDVYSIGVLLLHLLTGDPPSKDDQLRSESLQKVELELGKICEKCLLPNSSERYPSANSLAADLERWLNGEVLQAHPVNFGQRLIKWTRRKPVIASLLSIAALSLLILMGTLITGSRALREERNHALTQEQKALANEEIATELAINFRHHAYAADMYLANRALEDGQLGVARQMLSRYAYDPIRGFEWHAYQNLAQGSEKTTLRTHSEAVTGIAFSPDQRYLASVGKDEKLFVHGTENFSKILELPKKNEVRGAFELPLISSLIFKSPELREQVTSFDLTPDGVRMRGRPSRLGPLTAVAWSPDGKQLATASSNSYVRLFSFPEGRLKALIPRLDVRTLAYFSAGKYLALYENRHKQKELSVYEVNSLKRIYHERPVRGGFATHGNQLAFIAEGEAKIRVVEFAETITDHTLPVARECKSLAFSKDGKQLSGISSDGKSTYRWSLPEGRELHQAAFSDDLLHRIVFATNQVALAGTGQAVLVQSGEQNYQALRGHEDEILCLDSSPDGKWLASGSKDHTVKIWETSEFSKKHLPSKWHGPGVVHHGPKGERWLSEVKPGHVIVGKVGHDGIKLSADQIRHALSFNAKGNRVATWRMSDGIFLLEWWAVESGVKLEEQRIPIATTAPYQVAVDSERSSFAVSSLKHGVQVFSLETGEKKFELPSPPDKHSRILLSPGGKKIAYFYWPRWVRTGDPQHGWSELWKLTEGTVDPLVFSPDGKWLVSGNNENRIVIHKASTGKLVRSLKGHLAPIETLACSPDGQTIASASADRTLQLWHTPTFRKLGVLERGHERGDEIYYLGFDDKSRRLLLATREYGIRIIGKN